MREVVKQMVIYTVGLVAATLLLWPVASLGPIYGVTAIVLGVMFLYGAIALGKNPTKSASMRLFGFSISYVSVLFGAMMLDVFVEHGVS
jgi:protoheme IX farnesyltransferase